jgi:hypothetical protein
MGFDLKAKRDDVDGFHMGAFSWSWMIDAGVGLPLCCGRGVEPASYVYKGDPENPGSPHSNDGFRVTEEQAKAMAQLARWIADYQDTLYEVWMREPEEHRTRVENDHSGLYRLPVRRDFVEKVRRFADWAETSGGFEIH